VTLRFSLATALLLALVLPAVLLGQDGSRGNRGARIRIGGSYTLEEGAVVRGPLLIVGGSNRINGTVEDDVVTIGGSVQIGPTAVIEGDLRSIGGSVSIAPEAQIRGEVTDVVSIGRGDFPIEVGGLGDIGSRAWAWLAAWLTVLRLSFVLIAGVLLAAFGPFWMQSIGIRISQAPGWSLVTGFATELLITPAVVALSIALIITIVGIPLLLGIPVLLAVLVLLWIAGFTAVAIRVGGAFTGGRSDATVRPFLLGFVAICGLSLLSQMLLLVPSAGALAAVLGGLGLAIEYVAWTLGLGAALLTAFNRHGAVVPPPLPPQGAPQFAP
jgi:hypothetical protein